MNIRCSSCGFPDLHKDFFYYQDDYYCSLCLAELLNNLTKELDQAQAQISRLKDELRRKDEIIVILKETI